MPAVLFSDAELAVLQAIDLNDPRRIRRIDVGEDEMICQRDMKVRGVRLTAYHARLGDLSDYLPLAAA